MNLNFNVGDKISIGELPAWSKRIRVRSVLIFATEMLT